MVFFSLPFFSLEEKKQKNKFANEVGKIEDRFRLRQIISRSVCRQAPVPDCVLVLLVMCFSSLSDFPFLLYDKGCYLHQNEVCAFGIRTLA